jgi:uncharacterized cupin superfamily protein
MLIPRLALVLIAVFVSAAHADAPAPTAMVLGKPVKVTAASAAGPIFASRYAAKDSGPDGPATEVVMLRSRDGKVEMGLYEAGPSEQDIKSYEDDEFVWIISGSITLTSKDGSVLAVKAGEAAAIPRGWQGHWSTPGYRKYYVTYDAGTK